eukprot:6184488-Pleurochrysis_carterae.AAC.1
MKRRCGEHARHTLRTQLVVFSETRRFMRYFCDHLWSFKASASRGGVAERCDVWLGCGLAAVVQQRVARGCNLMAPHFGAYASTTATSNMQMDPAAATLP